MARHNPNATTKTEILEHLTENGFDGIASVYGLASVGSEPKLFVGGYFEFAGDSISPKITV
ncbi:MAG: hypothetical protein ACI8TQ_003766 [Planctomycetota bacterium]|jgi:hypothetical protein